MITNDIINEVYDIMLKLGASEEVLSVIGSWRDTLPDEEILKLLKQYNKDGLLFKIKDAERKHDINPNNN